MGSDTEREREQMVRDQLESRGISDERVLAALRRVLRHRFVPAELRQHAYDDRPLPIGYGQTISQPFIVARMTELVRPTRTDHVLDVGTGSGYQAALLAELAGSVVSLEIIPELALQARARLVELGYENVEVRCGDGYAGWPGSRLFDVIIAACSPAEPPEPLVAQLEPGGRMVLPVGEPPVQELRLLEMGSDGAVRTSRHGSVRFVPMVHGMH